MSSSSLSRRDFIAASGRGIAGVVAAGYAPLALGADSGAKRSPNERLNIGVIGVAGRGGDNLAGVSGENIVALCDVDQRRLDGAGTKHPSARKYTDYRRLIEQKDLDAIVVSTPDHTHTVIALAALDSGRPIYCEKPLTHTLSEAKALERALAKHPRVTQTGNQIHSGTNYRRVVELIQSGAIGLVREVHHWTDSTWDTKPRPAAEPVPAHLDYDLWLGPVTHRDYSSEYVPFNWRRWWHFGGGTLADFCCHHIDLGVWALKLGLPTAVEAEGPAIDAECAPPWLIVHYEFGARDGLPPVRMHWYSGKRRPQGVFPDDRLNKWGGGSLFVGEKGMLLADYGRHVLFPEEKFKDFKKPAPFIRDSIGHHKEFIEACKGRGETNSPMTYGLKLTKIGHLGNLAFRTGRRIEWDDENLRARGCPEADRYIHHQYRAGWKI